MKEVTRNVILDLLPLYLDGEVSQDTRILVESYLKDDPEVAAIAEDLAVVTSKEDIPVPLTMEDKMEAYKEAKRWMFWRTVILASIISITILALLVFTVLVAFMFIRV